MGIIHDKFIATGKSHFLCEDYILSKPSYIILSDGCSAVDDSDVGARLLCLAASRYLHIWKSHLDDIDYYKMGIQIISSAEIMARAIGISISCLAATLIVSYYHKNSIYVLIYGDGFFITVDNFNKTFYSEITFTDNRPFYLSYYLSPDDLETYKNSKTTKTITNPLSERSFPYDHPTTFWFPMEEYKTVAIATDGISSFITSANMVVDREKIIKECVNFKNNNGAFLQRRMTRFLSTFAKDKIIHEDDISIGAYCREE